MSTKTFWKIVSAVELLLAIAVILLDLFIPTLVILGLIVLSLLIRREKISALGFKRPEHALRMAGTIFALVIVWNLLQLSLFMPVLEHLTGSRQDLSAFENLKGNLGNLLFYLLLTWTLAAFGEEIVYRGYLQKRIGDLFGNTGLGVILAHGFSNTIGLIAFYFVGPIYGFW